ncbi:MAG: MotA/TolQ/ExbB proton channel family protein [Pseudomonadota bacterium]|nr:MotA/TolQ/ExbB proton channel family protein [Pseudomonadota bacterium]MEE3260571.1 MotA/TolQ/ExbB proton channel family protein [Pseudomonadota bacterium]|tara:strand:+ start:135 stop:932 length:798 start_codon:yes stop_codon:yes gene_type:complete
MYSVLSSKQGASTLSTSKHGAFLVWVILMGLISFLAFFVWDQGFLGIMYASDKSYITFFITALFLGTSTHCGIHTYCISKEINATTVIWDLLSKDSSKLSTKKEGLVTTVKGNILPECLLSEHIFEMIQKFSGTKKISNLPKENSNLINSFSDQINNPHDIGWFVSETMLKLGLLGTVIGFVIMLSSVTDISSLDVDVMQDVLSNMSAGMGVALFTTLAGLVFGMLLSTQYYFLDKFSNLLVVMATKIIELQIATKITHGKIGSN